MQDENGGWLTEELMDDVADYLGMPKIAVYEVATFYSMFDLKPVGRHKVSVCTNISVCCVILKRLLIILRNVWVLILEKRQRWKIYVQRS